MSTGKRVKRIKGYADMFEPQSTVFTFLDSVARDVFGRYGARELRTPVVERTELFARSIGDETDVVQKEMYTFDDRRGRSLSLRPEATAGVARAYIDGGDHGEGRVQKLFTFGPMFRYERPQKGRLRQFHQLNYECFGADQPQADAEAILMLTDFLGAAGLTGLSVQLNSLGCPECRPAYTESLLTFLNAVDDAVLCEDCTRRKTTNPMRLLDCKVPGCKEATQGAPTILASNCEACSTHFVAVRSLLDAQGVRYEINDRLVRGLDYYVRTTFEVTSDAIGSQSAVAGGGRYDGLLAQLGGPKKPGVGFACGMERLALLLEGAVTPQAPDFHVAVLDETCLADGLHVAQTLRRRSLRGEVAYTASSMKSQMRAADKSGAAVCYIIGETERAAGTIQIKDMATGEQRGEPLADYLPKPTE